MDFYIVTSNTARALWISKTDAIKYLFNQYWSMHQLYGPPTMTNIKTHGRVSAAKRDTRRTVCYLQEAESS